jgi:hypothetical protein
MSELKSIGVASGLVLVNIVLIFVFAFTPLATVNAFLFQYIILGMLVYGALLSGGLYLARKGVKEDKPGLASGGTSLIQLAYGTLGAGIIDVLNVGGQLVALTTAGLIAFLFGVAAFVLVKLSGHDFSAWGRYANYLFFGALGTGLIATFVPVVSLITFILIFAGFLVFLIHELYVTEQRPNTPYLNGVGLYTAFMGVFIEILKLVVRLMAEE